MTAQTQVQRNRAWRQRRAEKIARMERMLRWIEEIACPIVGQDPYALLADIQHHARQALNPGKEMGE